MSHMDQGVLREASREMLPGFEAGLKVCRELGIPYVMTGVDETRPLVWDGRQLQVGTFRCDRKAGVSDFWHDIAHWIVATEEERREPEFGLGPSPDGFSWGVPRTLGASAAESREKMSSALGIHLLVVAGLKEIASSTVIEHGWDEDRYDLDKAVDKVLQFLDRRRDPVTLKFVLKIVESVRV